MMAKRKNDQAEIVEEVVEVVEEIVEIPKETIKVEEKVKDIKSDESPRFTITQLVNSNRYKKWGYLLENYLKSDKTYTLAEVDKIVSELTKR